MKTLRVWDLPLRLFHWSLVLLVIAAVASAKLGGNFMDWHLRAGYAILALLLFRLAWGVIGSRYARFAQFLVGPRALLAYLRGMRAGAAAAGPGHHPPGGWAVLVLLLMLLLQAASGLFANDDIAVEGPLVRFITKELSDQLTWLHAALVINGLYAIVALHVLAIGYYQFRKKQDLLRPMFSGDVLTDADAPAARDGLATRLLALAVLALCAAGVAWLVLLPA